MSRFRKQYRELSVQEKNLVEDVKSSAETLESLMALVPDPRYRALALTALEEAVMWATKGIT